MDVIEEVLAGHEETVALRPLTAPLVERDAVGLVPQLACVRRAMPDCPRMRRHRDRRAEAKEAEMEAGATHLRSQPATLEASPEPRSGLEPATTAKPLAPMLVDPTTRSPSSTANSRFHGDGAVSA